MIFTEKLYTCMINERIERNLYEDAAVWRQAGLKRTIRNCLPWFKKAASRLSPSLCSGIPTASTGWPIATCKTGKRRKTSFKMPLLGYGKIRQVGGRIG